MSVLAEYNYSACSRKDVDYGFFTVQTTDIPSGPLRRRTGRGNHKRFWRTLRLAPITENEENLLERSNSISNENEISIVPSVVFCQTERPKAADKFSIGERSKSFACVSPRKPIVPRLQLDLDTYEEELENISEDDGRKTPGSEVFNVLRGLPPRPKCKRKVLPPSVTVRETDKVKNNTSKLLKLRTKTNNKVAVNGSTTSDTGDQKLRKNNQGSLTFRIVQNDKRPQSADSNVRVVTLSNISYVNQSPNRNLPTMVKPIGLTKSEIVQTQQITSMLEEKEFDAGGALSTPRKTEAKNSVALRGTDITSFYNMWERSTTRRAFDRKGTEKGKARLNRDCACSVQNNIKGKYGLHKNNVLPPINSSVKETCM